MPVVAYLPLVVTWTVAVMSPGPDFLAVLRSSASQSRRAGLLVAVGVACGIACWSAAALVGLTALLARFEFLYLGLRLVGAAFLVVYGLLMLRGAWRRDPERPAGHPGEPVPAPVPRSGWRSWRLGLLTNLSNPKPPVFFGALFASLLPPSADLTARAEVLASMLLIVLGWFALIAVLASVPAAMAAYRRGRKAIDTIAGGLFVALGVTLARP